MTEHTVGSRHWSNNRRKEEGFLHRIPLWYLHEGDEFVVFHNYDKWNHRWRHGVTTMDGRAISQNYGIRTPEHPYAERVRDERMGKPGDYINVQWDDPDKPYNTPYQWNHPNETLYLEKCGKGARGWVYVKSDVYHRALTIDYPWKIGDPIPTYEPTEEVPVTNINDIYNSGDRVKVTVEGPIRVNELSSAYPNEFTIHLDNGSTLTLQGKRGARLPDGVTVEKIRDPLPTTPGTILRHIQNGDKYVLLRDVWHGVRTGKPVFLNTMQAMWDNGELDTAYKGED